MTVHEVAGRFTAPDGGADGFEEMAEAVFRFQVEHNDVYRRFVANADRWDGWRSAPALPVEAFKLAAITAFPPDDAQRVFKSSGTAGMQRSKHYVRDIEIYDRSALTHFVSIFGTKPGIVLGHLPGYADGGESSSLVYMVERIIEEYGDPGSGLFLDDRTVLHTAIDHTSRTGSDLILFGAAFGLLDLIEAQSIKLPSHAVVIETGGMKTHRRAITREELHARLAAGFELPRSRIRSEYGMAELLTQCYTGLDGLFRPPPWMRFKVVDPEEPDRELIEGQEGTLCFFDIANMYTVSAIATQDLAIRYGDGFEVIGRMSGAELRGCNFLLERDA